MWSSPIWSRWVTTRTMLIFQPGAYDEAVKGVEGVIHAASPVELFIEGDPSLVIDPAVKGTTGLLDSLHKHAPNVKRVVVVR